MLHFQATSSTVSTLTMGTKLFARRSKRSQMRASSIMPPREETTSPSRTNVHLKQPILVRIRQPLDIK